MAFIDYEKAFDWVDQSAILEQLYPHRFQIQKANPANLPKSTSTANLRKQTNRFISDQDILGKKIATAQNYSIWL